MQNLRDVGGLTVVPGGRVREAALFRGDTPLPGDQVPDLPGWPPRTVLDLRSASEWSDRHPLEDTGATVHHLAFGDGLNATNSDPTEVLAAEGLAGLYIATLAGSTAAVAEAVTIMSDAELPILVHCAHGKDRTGILIAIVLDAIGVDRAEILDDYVATSKNMVGVLDRLAPPGTELGSKIRRLAEMFPEAVGAPESAIRAVFNYLDENGGTFAWLLANGADTLSVSLLRERLVE